MVRNILGWQQNKLTTDIAVLILFVSLLLPTYNSTT
jgi:hypothetical protein